MRFVWCHGHNNSNTHRHAAKAADLDDLVMVAPVHEYLYIDGTGVMRIIKNGM